MLCKESAKALQDKQRKRCHKLCKNAPVCIEEDGEPNTRQVHRTCWHCAPSFCSSQVLGNRRNSARETQAKKLTCKRCGVEYAQSRHKHNGLCKGCYRQGDGDDETVAPECSYCLAAGATRAPVGGRSHGSANSAFVQFVLSVGADLSATNVGVGRASGQADASHASA